MPRYLLEGTATPEVYASLIQKPEDRADNARGLIEKAGCKLIGYYNGVNNYKTYVIIECPDDAALAAIQFVMFAAGGITEGTATQIVTSAETVGVAQDAAKLAGSYQTPD